MPDEGFIEQTQTILRDGGWLMVPLVLIALMIYGTAFALYFYFSVHRFYKVSKDRWLHWVLNPVLATGEMRRIIDYTQGGTPSEAEVRRRFQEVRAGYLETVEGWRRFLMVMVTCAPLMGLLGTVTGMLTTFAGIGASGAGDTIDNVAGGISEALITTQTGLIIAIPAYVIHYLIVRRRNKLQACLTSLETITVQHVKKSRATAA